MFLLGAHDRVHAAVCILHVSTSLFAFRSIISRSSVCSSRRDGSKGVSVALCARCLRVLRRREPPLHPDAVTTPLLPPHQHPWPFLTIALPVHDPLAARCTIRTLIQIPYLPVVARGRTDCVCVAVWSTATVSASRRAVPASVGDRVGAVFVPACLRC